MSALILALLLVFTAAPAALAAPGSYSAHTPLSGADSDKLNNLRLAAQAIDGTIVAAGERFSFNDTVGPREKRRGYRTAPNGRGVQVTGGGVAQAASTLYMVLLQMDADVDIDPVKTYGARFTDDYVQNPSLAVVTDYDAGIDLSFTNLTGDLSIDMWMNEDDLWCVVTVSQSGGLRALNPDSSGLIFPEEDGKADNADTSFFYEPLSDDDRLETEDNDALEAVDGDALEPVDDDRFEAVDDDRFEAVDDDRFEAVDDDRLEPVNDDRFETVDDDRLETVDDDRFEAVDDDRFETDSIYNDNYTAKDGGFTVSVGGRGDKAPLKPRGSAIIDCGGNADVVHNVTLAADSLNDTMLDSGDVFSFNDVVGPRTKKFGYRRAVNGRGAKVTGGGVAQVASALWLAVENLDDVEIIEMSTYGSRYNQRYVADPADAILTDYASGRDFRFRYTGDGTLTIYAYVDDGCLYCDVFED